MFSGLKSTLCAGLALGAVCSAQTAAAETFFADVWADNWFSLSVDGQMVGVDSVPITTERSFNAESFAFEAQRPFVLGLVGKDFKENDSGLEYIGSRRQQMGDGGVILQIRDQSGALVAVSGGGWRCMVTHTAPLDKSCEDERDPVAGVGACGFDIQPEPSGWMLPGFDDSGWASATVHTAAAVSPKFGYDEISWTSQAEFIWGPDLETNNTVLCRLTVQ